MCGAFLLSSPSSARVTEETEQVTWVGSEEDVRGGGFAGTALQAAHPRPVCVVGGAGWQQRIAVMEGAGGSQQRCVAVLHPGGLTGCPHGPISKCS